MHDFINIAYLKNGSPVQRHVYSLVHRYQLLEQLAEYSPILVGSIPIDIQVEHSDIDIICSFPTPELFSSTLTTLFEKFPGFRLNEYPVRGVVSVVCNFNIEDYKIEIFGQSIPSTKQMGYLHLLVEANILAERDAGFKRGIISLKQQGISTEAAFCKLLDIEGDPYLELLKWS